MSLAGNHHFTTVQCPNCGVNLPAGAGSCPACGAPLTAALETARRLQLSDMSALIERSNQKLLNAGTNAAESAFGLGCSLGVILGSVLLVSLFLLGQRNWILFAIVFIGSTMIALAASVALSGRAKTAMIQGTFKREVSQEIDTYLIAHAITRQAFDDQAHAVLTEDAPLWNFLSFPKPREMDKEEVE
jgi:hypothetical protein